MLWPAAIYWINELLANTWVWLIEMPVWILFWVMKLEHWQVQPVGLILSSRKLWGVTEIIHTSKAAGPCWVNTREEGNRHPLIQRPGRFTAVQFAWVETCCPFLPHSLPFPPSVLAFLSTYCDLLPPPALTSQEWQEQACLWKAGVKLGAAFLNVTWWKERSCSAWLSCCKCSTRVCPWTWVFSRLMH